MSGEHHHFSYDANFWQGLAGDAIGPVVSFTFYANGTQAAKAAYGGRFSSGHSEPFRRHAAE